MKAISLWQPWATLIAIGAKTIETRHWPTNYRGQLLIHAAKTLKGIKECQELGNNAIAVALYKAGYQNWSSLPLGCYVCSVNLTKIIRTEDYQWTTGTDQRPFGNFAPGRFGWVLEELVPFGDKPAGKGQQGLWEISRNDLKELGLDWLTTGQAQAVIGAIQQELFTS